MGKKTTQKAIPFWAVEAMQGITYWVGHRHCLYRDYHLPEGALVAELCNLINANLEKEYFLSCETQYSNLITNEVMPKSLNNKRADLVIAKKVKTNSKIINPEFIIEVKRAKAPKKEIDFDLSRLADANAVSRGKGVRTFLFLISESSRPKNFVTKEKGLSSTGKVNIQSEEGARLGHYQVRRTLKASHSFKEKGKAQYACIIEVFSK